MEAESKTQRAIDFLKEKGDWVRIKDVVDSIDISQPHISHLARNKDCIRVDRSGKGKNTKIKYIGKVGRTKEEKIMDFLRRNPDKEYYIKELSEILGINYEGLRTRIHRNKDKLEMSKGKHNRTYIRYSGD